MHSPSSIVPEHNLLTHSSEPIEAFATGPRPVVSYFTGMVQRLIHDNIDYVLATTHENQSIEVLHAFAPRRAVAYGEYVEPYKPLRRNYHAVFDALDTQTGVRRLGLLIANAIVSPDVRDHSQSIRTYIWSSDVPDAVFRTDYAHPPTATFKRVLYGNISDPLSLNISNDEEEAVFKRDMMSIKTSEPLRPLSVSRHIGNVALQV